MGLLSPQWGRFRLPSRGRLEVPESLIRHGLTEQEAKRVLYGVDDSGYWEDPSRDLYVYRDQVPLGGYYEVSGPEDGR